jgi:hypothetical protein
MKILVLNFASIGVDIDRLGDIDTMNESFKAVSTITAVWEENKKIQKYFKSIENILNLSDNECHEVSYNELTKTSKI